MRVDDEKEQLKDHYEKLLSDIKDFHYKEKQLIEINQIKSTSKLHHQLELQKSKEFNDLILKENNIQAQFLQDFKDEERKMKQQVKKLQRENDVKQMTIKKLKQQLKECSDILTIDDQKEKEIQILTKKLNKLLYKSGKHDAEVAEYA